MKTSKFLLFAVAMVMCVLCAMTALVGAATTNPSPASTGYQTMVLPFNLVSSSRTGAMNFKTPVGYSVKSASIAARIVTGTSPTLKVRGKNGSLVNYSGSITAAGPTDLTIVSGASLSDEVTQQIDLVVGGTSPRFDNLTLILFLKRK